LILPKEDILSKMSKMTYTCAMRSDGKPLVWLHGEVKTPHFSVSARIEAGVLLRLLQVGTDVSLPHSRPLPVIGSSCNELRIPDISHNWRLIYFIGQHHIVIHEVFDKKTQTLPKHVILACQKRLAHYLDTWRQI
jgi:phage-related protein